jgi:hypothetical protein
MDEQEPHDGRIARFFQTARKAVAAGVLAFIFCSMNFRVCNGKSRSNGRRAIFFENVHERADTHSLLRATEFGRDS